jgi:acid phosphatase
MKALVEKMRASQISYKGDLAFFNNWELFWTGEEIPSR